MRLTIVAPNGVLCCATVEKASFPGAVGAFTVLPGHAPLLARLTAGRIVYAVQGEERSQEIASGFVRVFRDSIEACVEMPDKL